MSQEQIEQAAKDAIRGKTPQVVMKLLAANDTEKAETATVDRVLGFAAINASWDLVETICLTELDNKPTEEAILSALVLLFRDNQKVLFIKICQDSATPLSQKTIERLLNEVIIKHDDSIWAYLDFLCFPPENVHKPGQVSIEMALRKASGRGQWELARNLYTMKGANAPREAVVAYALYQAWNQRNLAEIRAICETSTNPPGQKSIENLLAQVLASYDDVRAYLDYLRFSLENVYKPVQKEVRCPASTDSGLGKIFEVNYQPGKDFEPGVESDSEQRRAKTLKKIRAVMKAKPEQAKQHFIDAYKRWLEQPGNKVRGQQNQAAQRALVNMMPRLLGLDGKLGLFGGETCLVDGKEIRIAKGAATILKHYQSYKSGEQPSAVVALNRIIRQAYHSEQYQGHWFFNRRKEEVSRFYKDIMKLSPSLVNQLKDEEGPNCGLC